MKRFVFRSILTLAVTFFTFNFLVAQDLTGIWKGYFITESGDFYKLEFQVNQSRDNGVSGVSYSYLDVRFYGKASMTGMFIKNSGNFKIREIKTVEIKNVSGGGACIMNFNLHYKKSGKEEFLEGDYLGKTEVKNGPNPYKWGQCGGGKVFLRRVMNSDFYVEPFLRNKIKREPVLVNQPPVKKEESNDITKNSPVKKDIIVNQPPVKKQEKTEQVIIPNKKTDTITKINNQPVITKIEKEPPPPVIKNRSNELVKTLTVRNPDVIVKIYDNGEIDDDTISVYLDNKLMLSSQRLTASPLILKFHMGEENETHELVMVAENLGRIPPNTSLMIVESGEQRFDVRITSTEQKNAVVRFKYQPSN
jgi:hypothetical protein